MQKKHSPSRIEAATRASKHPVSPSKERWASDVIVDLLPSRLGPDPAALAIAADVIAAAERTGGTRW
jgi:hypothetical protein